MNSYALYEHIHIWTIHEALGRARHATNCFKFDMKSRAKKRRLCFIGGNYADWEPMRAPQVGKELFIEATADQLILRTLNDAKSAFAAFYFNDSGGFFESFRCVTQT